MNLGEPIKVRLKPKTHYFLAEAAAQKNKPLSTYIREELEKQVDESLKFNSLRNELATGMAELRGILERGNQDINHSDNKNIMIEILLLLRTIASPQKLTASHAELKRQGYELWKGRE